MHKANFSAQLSNAAAARQAAAHLGLTLTRGAEKGQGSIRRLIEEISVGETLVLMHVYEDAVQMREAAARIRALADSADRFDRETIRGLANALEHAAELHE